MNFCETACHPCFLSWQMASWQTRAPSLLNNSPGDGTWLWPWKAFGSVEIIVVLWPILGVENAISPLFKLFLFLPGYTLGDCILYPLSVSQTHLLGKVFIISKYMTILVEYHWGASVIGGASFPTNSWVRIRPRLLTASFLLMACYFPPVICESLFPRYPVPPHVQSVTQACWFLAHSPRFTFILPLPSFLLCPFIPGLWKESSARDVCLRPGSGVREAELTKPESLLFRNCLWGRPVEGVFASVVSVGTEDGYVGGFL